MSDMRMAALMLVCVFAVGLLLALAFAALRDYWGSGKFGDLWRIVVNLACATLVMFVALEAILVDAIEVSQ